MPEIAVAKSYEVGGLTFAIKHNTNLIYYEGNHAQTDYRQQLITIGYSHTPDGKDEMLWHELTHAVNHVFLNSKLTEDEVNSMATGQYQILKQMGIKFTYPNDTSTVT